MLSFIQDVNLLVMALDQGSVGCAGVAFAEDAMDAMVHSKWDKFHRVVRDCKLSFQHACQGCLCHRHLSNARLELHPEHAHTLHVRMPPDSHQRART